MPNTHTHERQTLEDADFMLCMGVDNLRQWAINNSFSPNVTLHGDDTITYKLTDGLLTI